MGLFITIGPGVNCNVSRGGNLENLSEEERTAAFDMLFGLQILFDTSQEMLVLLGSGVRLVDESINNLDYPDNSERSGLTDVICDRLAGDNVIPLFDKDKLN